MTFVLRVMLIVGINTVTPHHTLRGLMKSGGSTGARTDIASSYLAALIFVDFKKCRLVNDTEQDSLNNPLSGAQRRNLSCYSEY